MIKNVKTQKCKRDFELFQIVSFYPYFDFSKLEIKLSSRFSNSLYDINQTTKTYLVDIINWIIENADTRNCLPNKFLIYTLCIIQSASLKQVLRIHRNRSTKYIYINKYFIQLEVK